MSFHRCLNISIVFILSILFTNSHAATFDILNNCSYPIWSAAVPAGGGRRLDHGQTWILNISNGTSPGRIWARTNCSFDASGKGHCQTGDCDGLLECKAFGSPPNTLAEYALNQFNNQDFYDISLVDGFNVPLEFVPISNSCSAVKCTTDINGQCPAALRAPGGCNNPCTVFKTNEYCCFTGSCGETEYSRFFRTECPEAYSSPQDDHATTTVCPGGTNYRVVFCP